MRVFLLTLLMANSVAFAADNLGYTASLNDEDNNNAVILPSSNGAQSNTRPYIQLPSESLDSNFIVVPMPESLITEEASDGRIRTKPIRPIIK